MRRSAIERLLPAVYQEAARPSSVLAALLDVMEQMHEPGERWLGDVPRLFAPYRAPDRFIRFLAGWVALGQVTGDGGGEPGEPVPVGRLRNLVAEGARLAKWRGTAEGLRAVVEIVTGVAGFVVEESPQRPFHVVVRVPAEARSQLALVRRVVEIERPAAVTYDVVVDESTGGEGASK